MTVVDGRTRRGERNREAIIDALIACYDDGILRPSVQEVADRAGVSARSVHNHFVDVEALRAEVAQRQWERCSPFVVALDPTRPVPDRVAQLVDLRSALYEEVTPVRRAALLSIDESPTIAANLACLDRALRRQIDRAFDLEPETLDAVDAARVVGCLEPPAARAGLQCCACPPNSDPNHSHPYRRSRVMSAIKPNKQQFVELMEAPDEGPVVMLNLLKFKAHAEGEAGSARGTTYKRYGETRP